VVWPPDPSANLRALPEAVSALDAGGRPVLAVSPHLDDAVLSAGGLLATLTGTGVPSVVLTPFAGDPGAPWSRFAREFHAACGLADETAIAVRRAEDRAALDILRSVVRHGDLLDAIYRRDPDGAWLYDGPGLTFGPRHPADVVVGDTVAALLASAVRGLRPGLLLGPLAIGDHVDHVVVREAVVATGRRWRIPVLLWEDQPYALRHPSTAPDCHVQVRVPADAWARRLDATGRYRSQLRMLFSPGDDWRTALTSHATGPRRSAPTERYWPVD
jgi:LmbE family N-acetylglucosaminyl deacetylase